MELKKPVLIILIFLNISGWSFSQVNRNSTGYIGTTQGITFSQLYIKDKRTQAVNPGYTGGILFTYSTEPHVGIRVEFNYVQKGWKLYPDSSENYSRKLNYFEFPFMCHILLGKKKSKFLIDLGPYASYLNFEEEKTNITNGSIDYVGYKVDRKFDFGYCLGIGYEYHTKAGNFGIEARYSNSITSIFTPSGNLPYFASRNQVLSFCFKYSVRIF